MKSISFRSILRPLWFTIVTIFVVWQWYTYQARGIPRSLYQGNAEITVEEDEQTISFRHTQSSEIEVIFFPGGLVDPEAYVPLARRLAEAGYNLHIIKMPWRMSTKGYNQIKTLFDLTADDGQFVLGGHSQGGKMAAQFVYENPGLIDGLFLLGTSHPRDIDLSRRDIPTIKIYAEFDGLASVSEVKQNEHLMPRQSRLTLLEGGNHSQFAFTGHLLTDGKATISLEQQQEETLRHLLEFMNGLSSKP